MKIHMQIHPLAKLMPEPTQEEYIALKKDIKEHGQRLPILLFEGQILDGRTRALACEELGIEPVTENFKGGSPTQAVVSLNLNRRHLTASQKSMLAEDIEKSFSKEAKERQRLSEGRGQKGKELIPYLFDLCLQIAVVFPSPL